MVLTIQNQMARSRAAQAIRASRPRALPGPVSARRLPSNSMPSRRPRRGRHCLGRPDVAGHGRWRALPPQ